MMSASLLDAENKSNDTKLTLMSKTETINYEVKQDDINNIQLREFRLYQFTLFLITQAGYFAVGSSMLESTFLEPSTEACDRLVNYSAKGNSDGLQSHQLNESNSYKEYRLHVLQHEFYSLAVEWHEECVMNKSAHNPVIIAPTLLMAGATIGSFSAGFLADRFGRKPIVIGCLIILCLTNVLVSLFGSVSIDESIKYSNIPWQLNPNVKITAVYCMLFISGASCGGYMVTNMVFLVEALHNSAQLRLLVVSLNGWPLGMIFVAIMGALTAHWLTYHFITALAAISVVLLLEAFSLESFHWHLHRGDHHLALEVQKNIQKRYAKFTSNEGNSITELIISETSRNPKEEVKQSKYTYIDLFRYKSIFVPLAQLSYCFFSSSIVSYGLFFSVDALPGNRYMNLAIMGAGKFVLGLVSFFISFKVGRRIIMIVSLGISCILCWTLLTLLTQPSFFDRNNSSSSTQIISSSNEAHFSHSITWLALALTAALDPTWKINHLFSTELFPVQVRNMARGLCNVAARIGSMAGPLMIYLRTFDESLPFWVYCILLTIQFIIAFTFPETKNRTLLNKMPNSE